MSHNASNKMCMTQNNTYFDTVVKIQYISRYSACVHTEKNFD